MTPLRLKKMIRPLVPEFIMKLRGAWIMLDHMNEYVFVGNRPKTYDHDGMIIFNDADFLQDPLFLEAYRLGKATGSFGQMDIEWRVYVACWAAQQGLRLEGDFVECGVSRGGLSRAIMHYIDFNSHTDRKFYLLDTYCGFPEDLKSIAAASNLKDYSECYDDVVKTFSPFPNTVIVRGRVPDTLPQVEARKVCYLSLDMNVAEPEIAAAEYFWDRMSSGAIILLDDYGFGPDYLRQKHAMDEFARSRGVSVLLLPTGQGIILKP